LGDFPPARASIFARRAAGLAICGGHGTIPIIAAPFCRKLMKKRRIRGTFCAVPSAHYGWGDIS
jgi:hypothetical protein